MLTDFNKTSTLWKNYKGWGSTHAERETFEELYRAYNEISTNSVLTYGDLLPRKKTDKFYEEVASLDATNDTLYYEESSFKTVPLVKKYIDVQLKPISHNCNHAFVIADSDGKQIRNIIPYDFSDTGLYNIVLKDPNGKEIPWGICDWIIDTNASLLTFNNGVPEGIDSENPPLLSFYRYVGPVGERHYIEAAMYDVENCVFQPGNPVLDITELAAKQLDEIEPDFFNKHKFNGTDLTQGIGLQYNVLSNIIETATKDPVKGYDDNSKAQVVSLLSHLRGTTDSDKISILFVSEGISKGEHLIQFNADGERFDIAKVNDEHGFFVVKGTVAGTYKVVVEEENKVSAVLLVKDDKTQDFELFFPREDLDVSVKLPVFADLIHLPPHLKLTALASYSDHITPQYYGPRVVDFVVAADNSMNWRSADFVVYNKENFFLEDALKACDSEHFYLRNGEYTTGTVDAIEIKNTCVQGECRRKTIIKNANILLTESSSLNDVRFEDCSITVKGFAAIVNCNFVNTPILIDNGETPAVVVNSSIEDLTVDGNESIFECTITKLKVTGSATLYDSSVIDTCEVSGKIDVNSTYIQNFIQNEGTFYINASRIHNLNVIRTNKDSILNTTNIDYVEALPEFIKINPSYVTKFSDAIRRPVYPNDNTIPFYTKFEQRVYAKLPDPFLYNEETNELTLKLDTIEHTIFINKNGELQVRFFSSKEIYIEDPYAIKTQIEDVYTEHADTVLSHPKPKNIDEALLDLYWSKADLKNGKVPIDQLPDAVAHGGLELVGMWSFEDSEGKYPTFADVDTKFGSDDQYTGLQNGWFFIVSASHAEDDPVKPQYSEDGVEWTAGDWIIYTGGKRHVIDFTKPIRFEYKGKRSSIYEALNDKGETTYAIFFKEGSAIAGSDSGESSTEVGSYEGSYENSYESSYESSSENSSSEGSYEDSSSTSKSTNFGTVTINEKGEIVKLYNMPTDFEIGKTLKEVSGLYVYEYTYSDVSDGDSWSKLDRAYLDPVYSRLPEFATKAGSENPAWSILDGGTGLLRLSYVSLAEALRLINETLLKLSPDRPTSIAEISVIMDEENTKATPVEVMLVSNGLQLNQVVAENDIKTFYNMQTGSVRYKQTGNRSYLPLECCFYCGEESTIKVYDGDTNITDHAEIERFDPYEKYRLGFKHPTAMRAAEVHGYVAAGIAYRKNHDIRFVQTGLLKSPFVTDDVASLEGETKEHLKFTETKVYDLAEALVRPCEANTLNLRVLNTLISKYRTGGYGYLTPGTPVTGTFKIENFVKYGIIGKDAKVEMTAHFGDTELPIEIESQTLIETDANNEVYDLQVSFSTVLPGDKDYCVGTLEIKAQGTNFGYQTPYAAVLKIEDVLIINPEVIQECVEPASHLLWPTLGKSLNEFGSEYSVKSYNYVKTKPELVWEKSGYGWPIRTRFIDNFDAPDCIYVNPNYEGVSYNEDLYRFVTFKFSFDNIHDLCGFNVHFDWSEGLPEINKLDGTFKDVILQVCVHSDEIPNNIKLLDGNKPVPIFFEAELKQGEACNHSGKSTIDVRRITFGRKPIPVQDIYIRVGLAKSCKARLRKVWLTEEF